MVQPNIVLIMTDQQRWDTLRCLGYEHMITPHIDQLAQRGLAYATLVRFDPDAALK